jgi:hypothetical protein
MAFKNGCKCQEQSNKTIYKAFRHPSIKEGLGYNRYDGNANRRNMINGVSCVKFNKGVALDELICKANNKIYIFKIQPTSNKTIKMKQSEAPKLQAPLPRCYASDYMCCWGEGWQDYGEVCGCPKEKLKGS